MHLRSLRLSLFSIGGWNALGLGLVLSWVGVLGAMVAERGQRGQTVRLSASDLAGKIDTRQEWMGAYFGRIKVGYVQTEIQRKANWASVRQVSLLRLSVAGKAQSIKTELALELAYGFRLESFAFKATTPLAPIEASGRVQGEKLEVRISLGGDSLLRSIPLEEPPAFDVLLPLLLARQRLRPQDRYEVWVFDPQALANRPIEIEVVGPEVVALQAEMVPAVHLRRQLGGTQVDTWIDVRGNILKEQYPFGLVLRREDEQNALTLPAETAAPPAFPEDTQTLLRMLLGGPGAERSREKPR